MESHEAKVLSFVCLLARSSRENVWKRSQCVGVVAGEVFPRTAHDLDRLWSPPCDSPQKHSVHFNLHGETSKVRLVFQNAARLDC